MLQFRIEPEEIYQFSFDDDEKPEKTTFYTKPMNVAKRSRLMALIRKRIRAMMESGKDEDDPSVAEAREEVNNRFLAELFDRWENFPDGNGGLCTVSETDAMFDLLHNKMPPAMWERIADRLGTGDMLPAKLGKDSASQSSPRGSQKKPAKVEG